MRTLFCLVLVLAGSVFARSAEPLEQAFQSALLAEEARRDLDAAIRGYEAIVAQVDAQRAIAATAVFRLGECYRKQGRAQDAVAQYQRLLRDYPGESTLVRLSRENLVALGVDPSPEEGGAGARTNAVAVAVDLLDEEQQEIQKLRTLFDRSPDLMDAPTDGQTPLMSAASRGKLAVVRALIEWEADPNRSGGGGSTPLHVAAGAGHKAVVEALLDAKAGVNAIDQAGRTPLAMAVANGYATVIEVLLARGAQPGAEPNQVSLFAAAENGRTGLIERLVRAGADPNARRAGRAVDGPGQSRTPLLAAVRARQRAACQELLRLGARLEAEDQGAHPLQVLLESGPFPELAWFEELLEATRKGGFPAGLLDKLLRSCVERNGLEAYMPALIAAGARVDPDPASPEMGPLVVFAAGKTTAKALEALLAAKPDVHAADAQGHTALHVAAQRGLASFVEPLLRAGADPNRLDETDRTPFSIVRDLLARTSGGGTVLRPGAPPPRPVGRADSNLQPYLEVERLLKAAGGREDVVRRLGVFWRRADGLDAGRVFAPVADGAVPTLADLLMFTFVQNAQAFPWPDLGSISVMRLEESGSAEKAIEVPSDWFQGEGCDWNVPLRWGDAVVMREVDRGSNEPWPGLPEPVKSKLWKCTARTVALTVKDRTATLELRPAAVPGWKSPNTNNTIFGSCFLGQVLRDSGLLRVSSDITRVELHRRSTGRRWTLDASSRSKESRFWLLDGDAIEVPDKPL